MKNIFISILVALLLLTQLTQCNFFAHAEEQENNSSDFAFHKNSGNHRMAFPDKSNDSELQNLIEKNVRNFRVHKFDDKESGLSIQYNLYFPEKYSDFNSEKFPLLIFIADASVVGKSVDAPLKQGYGALVWLENDDCVILVPEFPEVIIDDHGGFTKTEYINLTERLIQEIVKKYNINENRIYATGQSMGCMTLLVLAAKNPELFAAELFVSGQWDLNDLNSLESQKFFYVTAAGDDKASKGQQELMNKFLSDDISFVFYNGIEAKNSNEYFENLISKNNFRANFMRFKKGSVLPDDLEIGTSEHMFSFDYAYKIKALRNWLLSQQKR